MDEFISSKRSLQSLFGPDLFGPESMRVYSSCQLYTTHKAQAIHNQLHPIASCLFQFIVETIKGFMKKKKKVWLLLPLDWLPCNKKKSRGRLKFFMQTTYFFLFFFVKKNESWFDDCDWGLWPCRKINSMWKTCKPFETKRNCCWTTQVSWLYIDLKDNCVHWRLSR